MIRRLAPLPLVLLGAQDQPAKREPGTIRIEGSLTPGGRYDVEVAFPNLRFERPVYITHPRDGSDRLFVLEQAGRVLVFENRPDVRSAEVALDIRNRVYRGHEEEGLLGMAFHRDRRSVFLYYSANPPRRSVVSRFEISGNRIRPESERVVLEQRQPWGNHNGGMIEFGPDGYLYVSFGDGGAAGDPLDSGQDLRSWLGKILRLDVDRLPYRVPGDNPFSGRQGARAEIWAWGLRNVWRFSFDRATGALWAGDVGQDRWEEIDIIVRGGNYGWNRREGRHEFKAGPGGPFLDPIFEYGRAAGRSVTGGYVYRGKKLPGLVGAYLYGDYESGSIWALRWDGRRVTENTLIARVPQVSSFGEDRDGEVYFCSFNGRIYRFVERAAPQSPFPRRISQTGLFPGHKSLIEYSVRVPQWLDGATARRSVMVPGLEKLTLRPDGTFEFPEGTIFVRTIFLEKQKLETQLLIRRATGWAPYTYAWTESQDDAHLVDQPAERTLRGRTWRFSSASECLQCHNAAAGGVLGFRLSQLDAEALRRYDLWDGTADVPPLRNLDEEGVDAAVAIRSYLEVNCASCHRPGGTGNSRLDLRFSVPLEETGLLDAPQHHDFGQSNARLVVPGSPERSILFLRMASEGEHRMPPAGSTVPDREALKKFRAWIRSLK